MLTKSPQKRLLWAQVQVVEEASVHKALDLWRELNAVGVQNNSD